MRKFQTLSSPTTSESYYSCSAGTSDTTMGAIVGTELAEEGCPSSRTPTKSTTTRHCHRQDDEPTLGWLCGETNVGDKK